MDTETTGDDGTKIEVFVGTYDNYLFGYRIAQPTEDSFAFERLIGHPTHTASIRCIATRKHYLATGASDDRICVLDLRTNQEIQLLTHHTGTVTQCAFTPDGSHLFSASDDGTLAATKTGSWLTDNVWRTPHSGRAIVALALHPSGKLALTIGKDGTLRTWSLIKGRQCFTTNLRTLCARGETIDEVVWSPQGGRFALIAVDRVLVMAVGSAAVEREWLGAGKKRVTSLCWLDEERLLLGQEGGRVRFVRVAETEEAEPVEVEVHDNRVKSMARLHGHLVTISCSGNSGTITLWRLDADACTLQQLCSTQLARRPICLTLADASLYRKAVPVKAEQRKTGSEVDVDDDDNDDDEDAYDEQVRRAAAAPARRIVSLGRVTIETEGDDEVAATVSVLQAPKAKKGKKRPSVVAAEPEEEDDEQSTTTPAKKSKKQKKQQVIEEPEQDDENAVRELTKSAKKNKRKAHSVETPAAVETTTPTPPKKSKKSTKKLNQSARASELDATPTNQRRKSIKW